MEKQKELENMLTEERASWSEKISKIIPDLTKEEKLIDLSVISLSYREQIVDIMCKYRNLLRKISQKLDKDKAERMVWHITHNQLKIRNNEMLENFVRNDIADISGQQQLVKDQLVFFQEQLATLNSLQFSIKLAKEIFSEQ